MVPDFSVLTTRPNSIKDSLGAQGCFSPILQILQSEIVLQAPFPGLLPLCITPFLSLPFLLSSSSPYLFSSWFIEKVLPKNMSLLSYATSSFVIQKCTGPLHKVENQWAFCIVSTAETQSDLILSRFSMSKKKKKKADRTKPPMQRNCWVKAMTFGLAGM